MERWTSRAERAYVLLRESGILNVGRSVYKLAAIQWAWWVSCRMARMKLSGVEIFQDSLGLFIGASRVCHLITVTSTQVVAQIGFYGSVLPWRVKDVPPARGHMCVAITVIATSNVIQATERWCMHG